MFNLKLYFMTDETFKINLACPEVSTTFISINVSLESLFLYLKWGCIGRQLCTPWQWFEILKFTWPDITSESIKEDIQIFSWQDQQSSSYIQRQTKWVPAQEEGHIEKWWEESEELEGEHLDCEASLCGSEWVGLLWRHTRTYAHTQKH